MARTIAEIISNPKRLSPFMFKKLCGFLYWETPLKEEHGFEPIGSGRFSLGTIPFPDSPEGISRVNLVFSPRSAILGERDDVIEATFFDGETVKMVVPFSSREFVLLYQRNSGKESNGLFVALSRFLFDLYKNDGMTELDRNTRRGY